MKKMILLFTMLCASQLQGMEPLYPPRSEWSLPQAEDISQLPEDVQHTIINTALAASNNLVEAIQALKNASALYGVRYDLLKNTILMHALTKKFPTKVKEEIILAMEKPEMYQKLVTILNNHKNIRQAVVSIDENFEFNNLKDFTALMHMMADKFDISTEQISAAFVTPLAKKYQGLSMNLLYSMHLSPPSDLPTAAQLIKQGADINFISLFGTPLMRAARRGNVKFVTLLLDAGANPHLHTIANLNLFAPKGNETALDVTKDETITRLLEEAMKKW